MDSYIIHHTPEGLMLETDDKSVLIGEKDLPLIRRGITRPLMDAAHQPIGKGNHASVLGGTLVIRLCIDDFSIPARVWTDRSGIKRVILTSSPQAVKA